MRAEYERLARSGLKLDLTRGKPSPEQLSLLEGFGTCVNDEDFRASDGTDIRNYGGELRGLPEARALFAELLGVPADNVLVWNNSSLELMAYAMDFAVHQGVGSTPKPWATSAPQAIILTPGYDRHIHLSEGLGLRLVPVEITADGSYWNEVAPLVSGDETCKAVWVVPRYSNPSGHTLSAAEVRKMAAIRPAASDFRWFVDNAYAVHDLYDEGDNVPDVWNAFVEAGTLEHLYLFGSTAKVTWSGAALGAMAASDANLKQIIGRLKLRSIGPNKLSELRHVRYIDGYPGGVQGLMKAHAALLRPRFEAVLEVFARELADGDLATWSRPRGGYFINLDTRDGLAKRVVQVAGELGVKLTPAGSTWPGGRDPRDRNIRIAPSFPSVADVRKAAEVVAFAIKYAAAEKEGKL